MWQLTLFTCKTLFSKNAKSKVANQGCIASSSCIMETAATTSLNANVLTSSASHVEVSDNNIIDLTSDLSDAPEECNNYAISSSMFFTTSPMLSCSSTLGLISSSDQDTYPQSRAQFSSDVIVTLLMTVFQLIVLPASAASTHSSSGRVIGSSLSIVSTTAHTAVSSALSVSDANSSPRDIVQTPPFSPVRPKNVRFPYTKFGIKNRCFNSHSKHDWLE